MLWPLSIAQSRAFSQFDLFFYQLFTCTPLAHIKPHSIPPLFFLWFLLPFHLYLVPLIHSNYNWKAFLMVLNILYLNLYMIESSCQGIPLSWYLSTNYQSQLSTSITLSSLVWHSKIASHVMISGCFLFHCRKCWDILVFSFVVGR